MKRSAAAVTSTASDAKRRKTENATRPRTSGKFLTNGFPDPLRNYVGSYKDTPVVALPRAKVTSPKPEVTDGRLSGEWKNKPVRDPRTGVLKFKGFPMFTPNLTPAEVLHLGSFGGTYFRDIYSSVTKQEHCGRDIFQELPFRDWGLESDRKIPGVSRVSSDAYVNRVAGRPYVHAYFLHSDSYRLDANRYNVKCGGGLDMWESSGWINAEDPYGWFQWYCWFFLGRRTSDDQRQIKRWAGAASAKSGRFLRQLENKCGSDKKLTDPTISPVIRQTLQHWGVDLRKDYVRASDDSESESDSDSSSSESSSSASSSS